MTDTQRQAGPAAGSLPAEGALELVVITGMSGAGRTEAMHTFEDLGYFCIDNLPPRLLRSLVSSHDIPEDALGTRRLAVVCDARNRAYLDELSSEVDRLHSQGVRCRILFLDAADEVLIARYKASRRRHPLCTDAKTTIAEGIRRERTLLSRLARSADTRIDTSGLKPTELRRAISDQYGEGAPGDGLAVVVYSFGFKHGGAADADIVIDVRFLPNPYYDPEMRHLTGLDEAVSSFVLGRAETREFLRCWKDLLACVMPGYVAEGKQQLAIAVGCTGGQHRSVAIAEVTGAYLKELGYRVHVSHRDLTRADTKRHEPAAPASPAPGPEGEPAGGKGRAEA